MQFHFLLRQFKHVLVIALLMQFTFVSAQDYKFNHLGVEQGLSQSVINCILQDQRGFMWFGTQEGLNRYDGYNFKVYKHSPIDSTSLANNFIYSLYEDKDGIIWVGTNGGGLDALNPATEKFTHYAFDVNDTTSISDNIVRAIHQTKDGMLWIGTNKGLNEFNPQTKKFIRFVSKPDDQFSISLEYINVINEDQKGNLWLGTFGKGICMFDKATRRFYDYRISAQTMTDLYEQYIHLDSKRTTQCLQVRTLLFYDKTHLWIATNGGGIQIFNIETLQYESVMLPEIGPHPIITYQIISLCDDQNGNIWIGSFDNGLDIYHRSDKSIDHHFKNQQDKYSLNSSSVKSLYRDRNGNMWLGTNGEGINIYFRSTSVIEHIRKSEQVGMAEKTLKSSQVLCVMEDSKKNTWIGTLDGGLSSLNRETNQYTHYPQLSTAPNNGILSILEAKDHTIWIGTYGEGLNHYNPETGEIKYYTPHDRINDGTILCVAQEPETGAIWFGTFGAGLCRIDPITDSLQQFTVKSDSLSSDHIYSLFFSSNGDLWIGTRSGGLMQRDKKTGKITKYLHDEKKKESISNNIVYCIVEDQTGAIWLSTANGLNRFNSTTKTFLGWYENDGLPSDNIYAILIGDNGELWLSHNKGVTCFNPDLTGEKRFRNYGPAQGLQSTEFNQGAYFKNKEGEIFFGGQDGLNILNPKLINAKKTTPPPAFIISYKRFGKEIRLDSNIITKKRLDVNWRDNNFTFEIVTLNFVDPSKNYFQFKLEGYDDNWSPPTNNRFISYTNLSGGNYTLLVRTADENGNWGNPLPLIEIRIKPPFWKTGWFYTLCSLIIVGAIFGFVSYRTSSIKKENRILESKVAERTKELAQKNADITDSIQYARRIQFAILPELETIYRHLPDSFVLYKPKDIVSGDFYWFAEKQGRLIMVVADCTGHGVPGALMSMIGHDLLNQIVLEKNTTSPDEILNLLNKGVRAALKQDQQDQDSTDGMDIAVCSIDKSKNELLFAGALRPLIMIRNGVLSKTEHDRFPIGGSQDNREKKFNLHRINYQLGDCFYMFSDGFADQFGGPKGKKLMIKNLLDTLSKNSHKTMTEQSEILNSIFENWKVDHQQVDDVLLVGIRL
jgi:ligand-binding sensor domain-containing protein/serine phosphatase RsbU (regulator of sigma subunit)